MAQPPSTLQPTGLRHGIRHCPGGDDVMPCLDTGFGGKTYYVDPVNGLDINDGLASYQAALGIGPWQTLGHAFSPLPVSPLGEAVAGVKGPFHDKLIMLPGTYLALEAFPITLPAVKHSVHVMSSFYGKYNGAHIGDNSDFHTGSPILVIDAPDSSFEGVQINGPHAGVDPVIELTGIRTIIQLCRIWAKDDGGHGIDILATGNGITARIQHNILEILHADEVAIFTEEVGAHIVDNEIYAENAGGIEVEPTADYTRIFWNKIRSKIDPLTFGIKFEALAACCQVDENRIGRADPGVSGIERRVWDLGANIHFGRNWQMCLWDGVAPPASAIPRAGDPITDGGAGTGYSRD